MSYVVPVPRDLALISSLQGKRKDPITGKEDADHGGIDFAVPSGTFVTATTGGTVKSSAFEAAGGNFIILQHDDGKRSAYLHLNERLVVPGQRVEKDQLIATSGNTGERTTGAHLHFEVRQPATPKDIKLNPLDFLPGSFVLTDKLAKKIGAKTVSGGIGLLGMLMVGGAAYGGYKLYKKRKRSK